MARDAIGIFSKIWAKNAPADRSEFASFEDGWDSRYSTPSSGKYPERLALNDVLAKLTAVATDVNKYGGALPWDSNVDYDVDAFVTYNNLRYACILAPTANQAPTDGTYWTDASGGNSSESYILTAPSGGYVRTFYPNTATEDDLYDVLATILKDLQDAGIIQ